LNQEWWSLFTPDYRPVGGPAVKQVRGVSVDTAVVDQIALGRKERIASP
jgi:hypothetical protein